MTMYQRILVPTDGTEITKKAVDTAIELARLMGS
jgi:nucleotide-binding universal stress UspA family protein